LWNIFWKRKKRVSAPTLERLKASWKCATMLKKLSKLAFQVPSMFWMVLNFPNSFRKFTYKRYLRISYTTLIIINIWRFCLVLDQHMVLLTCEMIVILNSIFTIENTFGQNIRYHLDNLGHHHHPQFNIYNWKYIWPKIRYHLDNLHHHPPQFNIYNWKYVWPKY